MEAMFSMAQPTSPLSVFILQASEKNTLCNFEQRMPADVCDPNHRALNRALNGFGNPRRRLPMRSAFENAFTHAPIGMALVDMSGRLLRVNDALCRITGYTAEQLRARSFRDLSDPHDADVDASQNLELLDGRIATYQIEKRYQHAWGHSGLGAVERVARSRRRGPAAAPHRPGAGHLRAQGARGAPGAPRRSRLSDGIVQRPALRAGAGPGDQVGGPLWRRRGRPAARSRSFQRSQRRVRPQGGRRPAEDGRRSASGPDSRHRRPGAAGR